MRLCAATETKAKFSYLGTNLPYFHNKIHIHFNSLIKPIRNKIKYYSLQTTLLLEVKCVPPTSPYGSASTTIDQSVTTSISDYVCVSNYKWSDNTVRTSTKTATCTLNGDDISASWIEAGSKTCVGI